MNLPNKLTIARILLIPVLWIFLATQAVWAQVLAFFLFLLASLTDYVDGYIARAWGLVTDFGKFVEPIADKLLVTTVMLVLLDQGRMPCWAVVLFIAREFVISAFRLVAAGKGVVIAADKLGKYKTATQMVALCMLMLLSPVAGHAAITSSFLLTVAYIVLYVSLALSVVSCVDYIRKNKSVLEGSM